MSTLSRLVGVAAGALIAGAGTAAFGQETTSGLNGTVTDSAGSPLAGVAVTVLFQPTRSSFNAVSDAQGRFTLRQLPVGGPYEISARDATHAEQRVRLDALALGAASAVTIALPNAGSASVAEVQVVARRAITTQVQTGPTSTFTAADIRSLPTFGRDIKDIARLNPFVTLDPSLGTSGAALQIAGNQGRQNTIYVDGVKQSDDFGLNDGGYPTQRSPISIDVIQSFNVEVAPYDVQYGSFQGGVLNIATKSGGNAFHGSAFYDYDSSNFGGGKLIRDQTRNINFQDKTYGFTLGGPIIKDRVFFQFGFEKLEALPPAAFGPIDSGAANPVRGVATADVTAVQGILKSAYGYDAGGFGATQPTTDEKIFGKLQWNITDKHRFVFEAQTTDGFLYRPTGNNATTLALSSDDYVLEQSLTAYTGFLYSQWSQNFSTELSYTNKDVATITNNVGGDNFANFQVFLPSGSSIKVGPDQFRHANILTNTDKLLRARANYIWGAHAFTAGYEREELEVFNLFVARSNGNYIFNSIADLQAKTARQLSYSNAFDNVKASGAALWSDVRNAFYIQDEWRPLPSLTLKAGVRAELYQQDDRPRANPAFKTAYGISNQENLDGRYVILPRFGFNWRPAETFVLSGGVGRFAGGDPNVFISNNFSNTGNLLGTVLCNAASPVCADAVTNVNGLQVANSAKTANAASAAQGVGVVNALDPKFELPSVWKASISARKTFNFRGPGGGGWLGAVLGDDWTLHGDYFYQITDKNLRYVDLSTVNAVIGKAPDGRPVFDPRRSRVATNGYDLLLTNGDQGETNIFAVGLSKIFRNGWDADFTYVHQNVRDTGGLPEKVAQISVSDLPTTDPNNVALGISSYEVADQVKVSVGWERKVFGDFTSRIRLYGQRRSGSPFSYTFNTTSVSGVNGSTLGSIDPVFGLPAGIASGGNLELLYVPKTDGTGNVTATSDPIVTYLPGFDVAALNTFLKQTGLIQYAGQISPRNTFRSRDVTTIDLQLSQEIPAFFPKGAKGEVYFSIFNVGNLINSSWGVLDQIPFPFSYAAISASNCQAAFSAIPGARQCAAGAGNFYQYNALTRVTPTVITTASGSPPPSTWALKIGVRYRF